MSISVEVPDPSPAGVLADALAAVRGVAETLWSARSDDELVEVVGRVQQLSAVLAAVEAGAVAEADARHLAKDKLHFGSTGDWLTHTGGLHRGEGKRRVVRARALTGPLGRTLQGLVDGTVSPGQADIIVRAVEDLPSGDLVRRRGEKVLLRQASEPGRLRAGPGGTAPGRGGRPRHRRPPARGRPGAGGTRRPPDPLPVDQPRPGRRSQGPGPRHRPKTAPSSSPP